MRKLFYCVSFLLLLLQGNTNAQKKNLTPHALHVGEKLPDLYLAQMIHYKKKDAHLWSDFGGKPMIIDFWTVFCTPCVEALPLLDSIAKENAGKLSVVGCNLVPREDRQYIEKFFKKHAWISHVTLPSSIQDSSLRPWFPGANHQVWVNKDGVIVSISQQGQVNRENVKLFLAGKMPRLKQHNDSSVMVAEHPMLVIDENFNHGSGKRYFSYISGYDSVGSCEIGMGPHVHHGGMHLTETNSDLFRLYKKAYFGLGDEFKPGQFVLELKDSSMFRRYDPTGKSKETNWFYGLDKSKFYCYELYIRGEKDVHSCFRMMQQDLDRYFGLSSSLEKRFLPCYVIRKINEGDTLSASNGDAEIIDLEDKTIFVNGYWKGFINRLNNSPICPFTSKSEAFVPWHIVDETGYKDKKRMDLEIPPMSKWDDLGFVNDKLKKYNLVVSREIRRIDAIVVRSAVQ